MRVYKSENSYILVQEEDSLGSEAISSMGSIGYITDTITLPDPEVDISQDHYIGTGRSADRLKEGQRALDTGNLTIKPTSLDPFYYLLGARNTTTNGEEAVIEESDDIPSLTLQAVTESDTDLVRTFTGTVVPSGTISVSNDDDLTLDLDLQSLAVSDDPAKKQSKVNHTGEIFNLASSNVLNMFGVEFGTVQDIDINLANNSAYRYYIGGGRDPQDIIVGSPDLDIDATITITDTTIYEKLQDEQSEFGLSLTLDNGVNTVTITVTGCKIESAPHEIPDEEEIEVDVTIQARNISVLFE